MRNRLDELTGMEMIKILFQPFGKYPEKKLLGFGISFTMVGSFMAYIFNGRFDGVLDLHFVQQVQIFQPFLDNAINITCLALFTYFAGLYVNRKTRFIDLLIAAIVARIPYYLLVLFNINNFISNITAELVNSFLAEGADALAPMNPLILYSFWSLRFARL